MIEKDSLNKLYSASELKSLTADAPFEIEKQSVAHCINHAANTGEKSCIYTHKISAKMTEELKSLGYIVVWSAFDNSAEIRWR